MPVPEHVRDKLAGISLKNAKIAPNLSCPRRRASP